jgi:uncharacterized membrane protein
MNNKKFPTLAIVTALLIFALIFVFFQFWGTPLQALMNGIFALAIFGLLIASNLLLLGLVFFGVFAVYQILKNHINSQEYKQVEV